MTLLRQCLSTARMEAGSSLGEHPIALLRFVFRIVRVVVLLSVWRSIFAAHPATLAQSPAAILTYTLISEVFAEQLSPRSGIEWALHRGDIAMHYLQPMALAMQFSARMAGRWLPGLALASLPLLVLAPALDVGVLPVSSSAALFFLVSLTLSALVGVALDFVFATLSVFMQGSAYMVSLLRIAIAALLSGAVLPLSVLPYGLGDAFQWLPFASTASAPLRIYTGDGQPALLLGLQLFWAAVLWLLAHGLWRAHRERFVSYGG